jgi:hypothetical protein
MRPHARSAISRQGFQRGNYLTIQERTLQYRTSVRRGYGQRHENPFQLYRSWDRSSDGHQGLTHHLLQEDAWDADRRIAPQAVFQRDMRWFEERDLFMAEVSES